MNSIEIDVANYPETVALAGILVSEHWRRKVVRHHNEPPNWAPNISHQKFYAEVSRRLKIDYQPYSSYDPLATWMDHLRHSYQQQPAQT